jgi:hypothetical protein
MRRFFSRFKIGSPGDDFSSLSTLAAFYSLLIFLIAIPFILIVSLVWLNGILGFSTWIFAAFVCLCAWGYWRLYRYWDHLKSRMAQQGGEFQDLVREATRTGKDIEISLLNGVFTLRYHGQAALAIPQGQASPLALEGPLTLEAESEETQEWLAPERLREELNEFVRLRDSGVISPEEFDRIKNSLLQRMSQA